MHPRWVGYQLGNSEPEAIVLDDAISNSDYVVPQPVAGHTYFASGCSWAAGSGARRRQVSRAGRCHSRSATVISCSARLPALWSAEHYKAPFLTVVFVNRSYTTGTNGLKRTYPSGVAVRTENYEGGVFDPPPDFAKLAEAANCYGQTVREPEEVGPALKRGLEQVRKGTPALVAAYLPTLVEEMSFAQRKL
jgi:acetolactate synthase-1/2/3 large subunit